MIFFYDDFDDGVISASRWPTSNVGSSISETAGELVMNTVQGSTYYVQSPAISANDIPLAVMIDRVQFTFFFNDDQTRTTLNDIRRIFNCPLDHETLAGFNMPVGHLVKERTAIFPNDKLQEFSFPLRHPFFILHHLIKVAV